MQDQDQSITSPLKNLDNSEKIGSQNNIIPILKNHFSKKKVSLGHPLSLKD